MTTLPPIAKGIAYKLTVVDSKGRPIEGNTQFNLDIVTRFVNKYHDTYAVNTILHNSLAAEDSSHIGAKLPNRLRIYSPLDLTITNVQDRLAAAVKNSFRHVRDRQLIINKVTGEKLFFKGNAAEQILDAKWNAYNKASQLPVSEEDLLAEEVQKTHLAEQFAAKHKGSSLESLAENAALRPSISVQRGYAAQDQLFANLFPKSVTATWPELLLHVNPTWKKDQNGQLLANGFRDDTFIIRPGKRRQKLKP